MIGLEKKDKEKRPIVQIKKWMSSFTKKTLVIFVVLIALVVQQVQIQTIKSELHDIILDVGKVSSIADDAYSVAEEALSAAEYAQSIAENALSAAEDAQSIAEDNNGGFFIW